MTTLYGISNCDSVRKARKWLSARSIEYRFHDIRKDGLDVAELKKWELQTGWETLINRRGTTWRKLDEASKSAINKSKAIQLMLDAPTVIKRPVLEHNRKITVGFTDPVYTAIFASTI